MRNDKDNLIVKLSFEFALEIVRLSEDLYSRRKFVLTDQVLKSGTAIGANVREAQLQFPINRIIPLMLKNFVGL
jgi:hypothetical protein